MSNYFEKWCKNLKKLEVVIEETGALPPRESSLRQWFYRLKRKFLSKNLAGALDKDCRVVLLNSKVVLKFVTLNRIPESWLGKFKRLKAFIEKEKRLPQVCCYDYKESSLRWFLNYNRVRIRGCKLLQSKKELIESLKGCYNDR